MRPVNSRTDDGKRPKYKLMIPKSTMGNSMRTPASRISLPSAPVKRSFPSFVSSDAGKNALAEIVRV